MAFVRPSTTRRPRGAVARIAERIDDRPIRDAFVSSAMGGVER
jgi:hypothetical protein